MFFGGICLLAALQFWLITLVMRSLSAAIADQVDAAREQVYADLAKWFVPAAPGEPSEFGKVTQAMAESMADTFVKKVKMAALGSAGGKAERTKQAGGLTGNPMIDMALNYFTQGQAGAGMAQGLLDPGNNHKDAGNDYGERLAKYK